MSCLWNGIWYWGTRWYWTWVLMAVLIGIPFLTLVLIGVAMLETWADLRDNFRRQWRQHFRPDLGRANYQRKRDYYGANYGD